ncbi:MAG: flagellar hook-basal body complex protein [Selenomonadaceae bacterium]|nr:flagellar hook-basal body complex protein [Selenomonadaceae bacterium]
MMRSLYSGVSGLKNHQNRMDVVGNNISNVNTTGFKSSRVTFSDTLSQTLSGAASPQGNLGGINPKQIGLGSALSAIDTLFTDGSVQSTGVNTDLCLSGNGLFIVKNGDAMYYTRNGNFKFDKDGYYVNSDGMKVAGWMANGSGTITTSGTPGTICIPAGKTMAATATTRATFSKNLDAGTKGFNISNMLVTYSDGTTESVTSYNPTKVDAGLSITLDDGSTYMTTQNFTYTTGATLTNHEVWKSKVQSITVGTAGDVHIATGKGGYMEVNGGSGVADIKPASGTYYKDGTYTVTKTIKQATSTVDASGNETILLEFNETADGVSSVTVPKPENGIYKAGDSFTVELDVKDGWVVSSGSNDIKCENGQDATITAGTYHFGDEYVEKVSGKIASVNQSENGGYFFNGKLVSTVEAISSEGTSETALNGMDYNVGDMFYPSCTTTMTIHDSLGKAHSVPIIFTKTAENTWSLSLAGGGSTHTIQEDDGSKVNINLTASDLKFSTEGAYVSGTGSLSIHYTAPPMKAGESEQQAAADAVIALTLAGISQYAGSNTVVGDPNGNAAGTLKSVSIDSAGVITGTYTNGLNVQEGQIAIAQFNNASGLTKIGNSLYDKSNNSGVATIGTVSDLGCTITPSALEMSNVDMASELTDMIVTQRGYQSNSKIITVSDELLETLINMKR